MAQRCTGYTTSDVQATSCKPCKQQCPPGQYILGNCSGVDNAMECRACYSCEPGRYISSGACWNGTATSPEQRSCSKCGKCRVGEYILPSSLCDGTSKSDNQQCLPCKKCPKGYYIKTPCNGSGTSSNPGLCLQCKTCAAGEYRVGCDGDTLADDVTCAACPVPSCKRGQYIANRCDGTEFSPSAQTCKDCVPCALGQYFASGCTGIELTSARSCRNCTSLCPAGQYASRGCRGDALSFADKPTTCSNCSRVCPLDYYMASPCSGRTFSPTPVNCSRCTCPGTRNPVERCSGVNGLQDQLCEGGWAGPDRVLSKISTAATTTSASSRASTTASASQIATTPQPPPPSSGGDNDKSLSPAAIGGIVGAVAVAGLSALFFCGPSSWHAASSAHHA